MKKHTKVSMEVNDTWIDGVTMEDACASPTERNPNRMVVRVKWDDKSETIENIDSLYAAK